MKCEDAFLFCQELVLKCSGRFTTPVNVPIMHCHKHTEFVKSFSFCRALWHSQQWITLKYRSETQGRTNSSQSREWDIKTIIQPPSWQSRTSQGSCGTMSMEQEQVWVLKCILPPKIGCPCSRALAAAGSIKHQPGVQTLRSADETLISAGTIPTAAGVLSKLKSQAVVPTFFSSLPT